MATLSKFLARKMQEWRAGGVECVEPGNLLGLKIGSVIASSDPDFRDGALAVDGVNVITETIGDADYCIAEYLLGGTSMSLWVYQNALLKFTGRIQPVLFHEYWRGSYDDAMREGLYHPAFDRRKSCWTGPHPETDAEIPALQDPAGLFRDGDLDYRRRFGDLEPHAVSIRAMQDADGDGKVGRREVAEFAAQYWDYELDGAGSDPLMFVVEDDHGQFRILKGREVPFECFTILR